MNLKVEALNLILFLPVRCVCCFCFDVTLDFLCLALLFLIVASTAEDFPVKLDSLHRRRLSLFIRSDNIFISRPDLLTQTADREHSIVN